LINSRGRDWLYLQFFSRTPIGRDSALFLWNGTVFREVTVASQGYSDFTYSKKDPGNAEDFFRINFEDGYPPIARKIINDERLTLQDEADLFIFALITRFRSPAYVIKTSEERIDIIDKILGSACNHIEPITPADWTNRKPEAYLNRVSDRFKLKILKLSKATFISDNPVILCCHRNIFLSAIILPIAPDRFAVFYQNQHLSCSGHTSVKDFNNYTVMQRGSRMKNLYYPFDISDKIRRAAHPLKEPSENKSEVNDQQVIHHFSNIDGVFDFLTPV